MTLKVLVALKENVGEVMSLLDGHEADLCQEPSSVPSMVSRQTYDVVLLEDGLDMLPPIKAVDPRLDVIVFGMDQEDGIEAIKRGATAYFQRPLDLGRLKETVESISEVVETSRETAELEKQLTERYTFAGIVGRNPRMLDIFNFVRRIAPYYKIVTIMGETGVGKEEIAKAIHSQSPVADRPFIPLNCGALVENLVESEFFGHRKGSFTGAIADKAGIFEAAGEGTVFLDEIGDLPLSFQPHLLRVLQNGEFRRVGDTKILKARCRIIAATNRDLSKEVQSGRFREDLFFRLTPLTLRVPPLRDRKDDIPLLSRYFLKKSTERTGRKVFGISRPAQTALMSYHWPGNVRELESVIDQVVILSSGTFIRLTDLPEHIQESGNIKTHEPVALEDLVRTHIESVIQQCSGNKTNAAKVLGISRRALLRKLDKFSYSPSTKTHNC